MPRPKKNPTEPKKIKLKEQRIPMVKILNGKEIREAAKALEDFRLKFKEEEILYGAKLVIKYDAWDSDFNLIAERLETADEVSARLEKERLAIEAKKRREAERKAAEAKRREQEEQDRINRVLDDLRKHALKHGIPMDVLVDRLKV